MAGMKRIATLGTMLCATALIVRADSDDLKKRLEQELRNVAAPELPARAVAIVRGTPAEERARAAIIVSDAVAKQRPAAAPAVNAALAREKAAISATRSDKEKKHDRGDGDDGQGNGNGGNGGNGNSGNGNDNDHGNSGGNGGVGHGPGENKPGHPVVHDRPIKPTLPNGKPRHFPPDPPHRPVDPPRPHKYNKPHNH